jgi:hypothetical protein
MAVTPERKAELIAQLEEIIGPTPMERPKVVTRDSEVIRDADPHVSKADPNYPGSNEGVVRVRRNDFVTIRMDLWEAQMAERQEARRQRRLLDPYRLGHWGSVDDEDE